MQEDCFVSVIIPAYNCRKTIRFAIDSVLCQDVPLELLIIEDGSKETIEDIIEMYQDDRIRYLKNETNIGVSATRNRGVCEAKGNWIAFLDADDYWMEGKLKNQLIRLQQTGDILCSTARELMNENGELTGRIIPVKETITYQDMLHQNWINNSSILIKKEVLLEFPMEADEVHEDYLLWLRVLKKYKKVCAINEPFLKYRVSNSGKSGSKIHSAIMTYKTYRKAGMNAFLAIKCFVCYAIAGVKKYYT